MKVLRASVIGVLLFLACGVCQPACAQSPDASLIAASYRPVAGQVHPELLLPDIEHQQAVSLAQFRGKKVLLIHFASW